MPKVVCEWLFNTMAMSAHGAAWVRLGAFQGTQGRASACGAGGLSAEHLWKGMLWKVLQIFFGLHACGAKA